MAKLINCICLLAFIASWTSVYGHLNKFIRHFEAFDYDEFKYKHNGGRVTANWKGSKRDENIGFDLRLVFKAFGREFKLILNKDNRTIAENAEIMESNCSNVNLHANILLTGQIDEDKYSDVYGWFETHSKQFSGTLHSKNGTFYVEPARKYFKNPSFRSVIYRKQDIIPNLSFGFNFPPGGSEIRVSGFKKDLKSRVKRASSSPDAKTSHRICQLSLEADFSFLKMAGGSLRAIYTMTSHIQALNKIFDHSFVRRSEITEMSGDRKSFRANSSAVQFRISKVRVYNESETDSIFSRQSPDPGKFLELMENNRHYSRYCLALFFTARSFNQGVLGMATSGGVCSSSNAGVVTFAREDVRLPLLVTEIAVAHVVGHAFGAKHDSKDCETGTSNNGSFVMTELGFSSDQSNDVLFSPCTVKQIRNFVDTLKAKRCLEPVLGSQSLCGNGVTDGHEECDCGDEKSCAELEHGNCCDFRTCSLKEHAVCSVSNGLCCDGKTCSFKTAGEVCSLETECSQPAFCYGNSSKCPEPANKDDLSECRGNTSVCMNGICKSLCTKFGLQSCFCEDKMDECKICCLDKGKCRPVHNIAKIKSGLKSRYLSPGSLCAQRKGFCDMFHECHPINLDSPLSHKYFRKKGVKEITHQFWWAIFLATVGLMACVVVIIKHGILYTESSNPDLNELEPAKKLPRFTLSRLKEEEKGIIFTDETFA